MKSIINEGIYNDLLKKIFSGHYKKGDKLPTEQEFIEKYEVSRSPVRQALGKLQTEGLIARKPGVGSIVIYDANEEEDSLPITGGFEWGFNTKWDSLSCKTISVTKEIASKSVSEALKLNDDNNVVIKVERLRFENDKPLFLLTNYYKEETVDYNFLKKIGDIENMREFAINQLGLDFQYVDEEIKAVLATREVSYHLNIEISYPLLQINRTTYDSNFIPLEYVVYHVISEEWPYKIIYHNYKEGE